MRQREGFERISIESPIEKRLKERLKKLAELHKRKKMAWFDALP